MLGLWMTWAVGCGGGDDPKRRGIQRDVTDVEDCGDLADNDRDGLFDCDDDDCADDPERPPPGEVFEASVAMADTLAHFGPAFAGSTGCHPLPDAVDPLHVGPANLEVPALVAYLEGDPATPPAWASALAEVMGDAVVVSSNAEGHGAYLTNSWCLTEPITRYLVDLEVPVDGWSCIEPG